MRKGLFALIGSTALVAVAVIGLRLNSSASAAIERPGDPLVERFVLQASGDEATCTIEKANGTGRFTYVQVSAECDELLAGLSKARYWLEQPDGTVTLSIDGKQPRAVFAPGDGVAYESIEPHTPLLSLIESD